MAEGEVVWSVIQSRKTLKNSGGSYELAPTICVLCYFCMHFVFQFQLVFMYVVELGVWYCVRTACAHSAFYSALFAFKESNSCRILLEYVLTELLFRGNCNREKARKRILMLSYFMQSWACRRALLSTKFQNSIHIHLLLHQTLDHHFCNLYTPLLLYSL